MEQKVKFIIIGLIALVVIVLIGMFVVVSNNQKLTNEKKELEKQNTALTSKANGLQKDLDATKIKLAKVQSELDAMVREKQDIEAKYKQVNDEKNALVDKLKELQEKGEGKQPMQISTATQSDMYWAGVLKAKTDLELQLNNVSSQLKSAQISNEQLQREKSELELAISNIRREKEDVVRELEYNKKMVDNFSQDLVRERSDRVQVQEAFKLIKSENNVLSRQLNSLNTRKIDLEKRLQQVIDEKSATEGKFNEMQSMLTDKIDQINDLSTKLDAIRGGTAEPIAERKSSVELAPIVVRPSGEECAPAGKNTGAPYQSKVLAVNKENNFVIVDMGEDSGIKVGDVFQVYKNGSPIASIEAIQIRKNITACDIKKQKEAISVGDIVR